MPTYRVRGKDEQGKSQVVQIHAMNRDDALARAHADGLFKLDIEQVQDSSIKSDHVVRPVSATQTTQEHLSAPRLIFIIALGVFLGLLVFEVLHGVVAAVLQTQ